MIGKSKTMLVAAAFTGGKFDSVFFTERQDEQSFFATDGKRAILIRERPLPDTLIPGWELDGEEVYDFAVPATEILRRLKATDAVRIEATADTVLIATQDGAVANIPASPRTKPDIAGAIKGSIEMAKAKIDARFLQEVCRAAISLYPKGDTPWVDLIIAHKEASPTVRAFDPDREITEISQPREDLTFFAFSTDTVSVEGVICNAS